MIYKDSIELYMQYLVGYKTRRAMPVLLWLPFSTCMTRYDTSASEHTYPGGLLDSLNAKSYFQSICLSVVPGNVAVLACAVAS